jgi:hypothetical protein
VTKFATSNPPAGGLSTEDGKVLRDFSRFHEVDSNSHLPPAIIALCGKLAGLGQKSNATDAISDPKLQSRPLVWTALDGDHYERVP